MVTGFAVAAAVAFFDFFYSFYWYHLIMGGGFFYFFIRIKDFFSLVLCGAYLPSKNIRILRFNFNFCGYKKCSIILQKTFVIRDVTYYNSLTSDKGSYTTPSGCNITYSDDGMAITGTVRTDTYILNTDITLPDKYYVEMTVTGFSTGYTTDICCEDLFFNRAENGMVRRISASSVNIGTTGQYNLNDKVKIEYDANTRILKVYFNNILKSTWTNITPNHKQQFKTYINRSITVKDLIIQEL